MKQDPLKILGKQVSVHPAIRKGDANPKFMEWSVKVHEPTEQMVRAYRRKEIEFPSVADFAFVHLKDVLLEIKHNAIDNSVRNPEDGKKRPIILAKGTLIDYGNVIQRPKGGGWKSITYNPHKHPEYVENPKGMPTDWWHDHDTYPGFKPSASRVDGGVAQRIKDMQAVAARDDQPVAVTRKSSNGVSRATASEAMFNQHDFTPQEYMWVKGMQIIESAAFPRFLQLFLF